MKIVKTNVSSLIAHARKKLLTVLDEMNGMTKTHNDTIVNYSLYTPYVMIIQDHLTNLRLTYGDQVVKEAITLMDLDKKEDVA